MKVALTYPYCWPEVRRGGERLFHDVARYLTSVGIDVTSVSAQGPGVGPTEQPGKVVMGRARPDRRLPRGMVLDRPVTYLPGAARALRRSRPDLVHGMFHLDGVAARLAFPRTGSAPYFVHVQGMPRRENLDRLPAHRLLFGPSVRRAAAILAVSASAAEALEEEFGLQARVFHNGVYTEAYAAVAIGDRAPEPLVFFPADPGDPRKRLDVLVEAMLRLDPPWQAARLAVAGTAPVDVADRVRNRLGDRVDFVGPLNEAGMIRAYGETWVTCLPAVREAFGLVIVESLASGRPCVGVRDGGVAEILTEHRWLAEPDDADSLAAAMGAALADSEQAESAAACRQMARPFDWSVRGPALVDLYRDALGQVH
ncbi:MAG TPA: glycosyltransferase family 4 protein [Acidimicrobiales bacterium]|nr:glycosyltransferase family 4 protein [Acidimicrobiales bacterium]